jgi:hypothetical protein
MRLAGEKVVRASRACQGETSEISIKTNGCSLTQLCCACHIHSRGQMAYHLAERHAPAPPASTEETGLSGGLSQFHLQPESEMWKRTHFPNLRSSPRRITMKGLVEVTAKGVNVPSLCWYREVV